MGASPSVASTGPFTWKSTADEVAASGLGVHAKGKTVIVTGANCGLGLETSRCLAANGASVILMSRSIANGEAAVAQIKAKHPEADVSCMQLDLSSFESVRACAEAYKKSGKPLHVLINNAGVMACPRQLSKDGYELQIATNHLGHFLLTNLLLPTLAKTGTAQNPARVINLSSMGNWLFAPDHGVSLDDLTAESSYDPWTRYGESKLANILFTRELVARCQAAGQPVISVSVHPGAILETNLGRHANLAAVGVMFRNLWKRPGGLARAFVQEPYKNTPQGSATSVLTSLDPAVVSGAHYADCGVNDLVHPKGEDKELARALWEASVKATGL